MATKIVISKVSEPYADALLELAKANNCVDAITADVNDLLTFLTSVPLLASYCLLYTSPSPRDRQKSRMPSSA